MKKAIALFVLGIFLAGSAFGAVAVDEDGVYVGEAVTLDFRQMPQSSSISKSGSDIRVDFNYGAEKISIEADTLVDSLTTAEGGTSFVLTNPLGGTPAKPAGRVVNLPTVTSANDGLWYRISAGASTSVTQDTNRTVTLQASAGNKITYVYPSAVSGILKSVQSANHDSYATVKVVVVNGNWQVTETKGTWITE
jgi:hypothetical protein